MKTSKRILAMLLAMLMLLAVPVWAEEVAGDVVGDVGGEVTDGTEDGTTETPEETVYYLGAPAEFIPSAPEVSPYINDGSGAISDKFMVTSVNVTNLKGEEVATDDIKSGDSVIISCRIKANDSGKNKTLKLISAAYNEADQLIGTKMSKAVTLDGSAQTIGTILTVSSAVSNIKSYLWEGGEERLIPLSSSADLASQNANVLAIIFDGTEIDLESFTTEDNITYTYNETIEIPASQLKMPEIKVASDNLAAFCSISCDKGFPLTKQGDTEAASAVISVKLSLNGVTKAEYKFNVTQEAPAITNTLWKKWSSTDTADTTTTTVAIDSSKMKTVKEATYDKGYTRTEFTNNINLTVAKGFPSDYISLVSDRSYWMMYNMSPEFIGGTLLQLPNGDTDYTISSGKLHGSTLAAIGDVVTFDINRPATVYVWDNTAVKNGYTTDYTADTTLKLYFVNANNATSAGSTQSRVNTWYKKHFDVAKGETTTVGVPAGFRAPAIIVKFDDMEYPSYGAEDNTAIKSASFTLANADSATAATVQTVINPVVSDYDIEFDPGVTGSKNGDEVILGTPSTPLVLSDVNASNYVDENGEYVATGTTKTKYTELYKDKIDMLKAYNKLWTNEVYIPWEWQSDVLGGELVQLPFAKWNANNTIKSIDIELDESADVYLQFRGNVTDEQFIAAEEDMVLDGWRQVDPFMKKIWASSKVASSGSKFYHISQVFDNVPTEQSDGFAVMKHFEVPEGETVTVSISGGYNVGQYNKANAYPIVVVKKADRAEY